MMQAVAQSYVNLFVIKHKSSLKYSADFKSITLYPHWSHVYKLQSVYSCFTTLLYHLNYISNSVNIYIITTENNIT